MPTASYAPAAAPPSLGYGQRGEAPINLVNQWMRGQPWYRSLIQSFGQDPSNVHLNDSQKQQVIRAAQANGVIVDEGHNGQEVDDSGNFQAKSHALRNTLIVAGIAAASLATMGAAGVFGGAGAAAGAGASSGVGAIEGGAYGLSDAALAGLGGGAATAAGTAGAAGAGTAAFDAAGNFLGPSTVSSVGAGAVGGSSAVSDWLRYGVPVAGNIIGGVIQAKSSGDSTAAQQKYLEEALAYAKEKDFYNRNLEASRYATYSNNVNPYIATGQSANDRMAAALGLPARQQTAAPSTVPAPTPSTAEPMITVQAPTGQTKQVPASQREYWESKGGTVIQGAA